MQAATVQPSRVFWCNSVSNEIDPSVNARASSIRCLGVNDFKIGQAFAETLEQSGIEFAVALILDDSCRGGMRKRWSIRPARSKRIIDVRKMHDSSRQGDGVLGQLVGVTRAIVALMVMANHVDRHPKKIRRKLVLFGDRLQDVSPDDRVGLDHEILFGREFGWFMEKVLGKPDHA